MDLLVQIFWRKVRAVFPSQRVSFEPELFEVLYVTQRLKNQAPENPTKIDLTVRAVVEPNVDAVPSDIFSSINVEQHSTYSNGSMRLSACSSRAGSLRAPRKPSIHRSGFDLDRDFIFAILRMKMRRRVIAIEHANYDSKKSRDFRHSEHCLNVLAEDQAAQYWLAKPRPIS
jgi:hypothetical protein